MVNYTTEELASIINGKLTGPKNLIFNTIIIDSRNLPANNNSVFFALQGKFHDGHNYINNLYDKGVRIFVVNKEESNHLVDKGCAFIKVENTLMALHKLAAFHRKRFTYPVLAITGSNGKTVVKEWLYECLRKEYNIIRSPKSFNSQVGVPLSIMLMDDIHQTAIIEAGISMPGEMEKLAEIINPDLGILTMIGDAHQENFIDINQKIDEKIKLFKSAKKIYTSAQQKNVLKVLKDKYPDKKILCWSISENADLTIKNITKTKNNIIAEGFFNKNPIKLQIPFFDNASIENILLISLILFDMEYDNITINERIGILEPLAMRLELKQGKNNCTIINDAYNSDINSLSIAIDLLNRQNQNKSKTLILSDILESSKSENELYKTISALIKEKKVDNFIGIGEALIRNKSQFDSNSKFFESTDSFLATQPENYFSDEAILVKGARKFEFEKIIHALERKEHRTILEINLNALVHNLNVFRSLIKPSTKMMAMVKAFSYGTGAHEIAGLLQYHRIDYLGVAFVDEGITLRQSGINTPIIVMQPEEYAFDTMIKFNLEPEIYNFEILQNLCKYLKRKNIENYPVHIKFDTGMNRMGFLPDESDKVIETLKETKELLVKSVFSHLAASDEPAQDDFTHLQIKKFNYIRNKFLNAFDYKIIFHLCNSEGIVRFPEAQFDMVRLGIGLYGICNSLNDKLMHIGTLKSTIIQVKKVNKGESVGYNRKWIAQKDSEIAIVPIGYADGINRKLGNGKGYFIVKNNKVPIVGNICMDVCMIDVTGLNAKTGDEVIIFGKENTVQEIADVIGTIPYEILTSISGRVKRIYYQE
jgi:alanine racemase